METFWGGFSTFPPIFYIFIIIIIMTLTFYHVFDYLYLILVNSEIAGKIVFSNKQELIILDIQCWFFHKLKDILVDTLLLELGWIILS